MRASARRLARIAVIMLLAALFTVPAGLAAHAAPTGRSAATPVSKLALLDVVMVVDESGSETPQSVADERSAAGTVVQSLLNPQSRVTVVGFGGVDDPAANQNPVDVECQPTIASGAANLGYLSDCVGKLHRRSDAEGNDTDYAAALNQAMDYLSPSSSASPPSPSGAIKVILMMTDGAVDVHRDTQQYGTNWQLGEEAAVSQKLASAKQDGVQVWPLGFGDDAGTGTTVAKATQYLNTLAAGGAAAVCDTTDTANKPHATWVNNEADLQSALNELYADSACIGSNTGAGTKLLKVSIPAIASAAAISVARVNPAITVSFTMPNGQTWTDASQISGQDSPVEVLHLYNIAAADVGTWQIHVTAPPTPPGLASQVVRATAFWQGAVRAEMTASPPSAKLGQQVSVDLSVLTPTGVVSDPATLKSLHVDATVTGAGLPGGSQPVTMTSVGPGHYQGTFTAPDQATNLTVKGNASGYGLYTTNVPATVAVGTQAQGFVATPGFSGQTSVPAGGEVGGQVVFTNQSGTAKQVRLVLTASGASAQLASPSGSLTIPPGASKTVPFTVSVSKDSPTGSALFQLKAVDATTGQLYNSAEQSFTVTKPPGFFAQHEWEIIGLLILLLLILLGLYLAWQRSRAQRDVRRLVATLRRGGVQMGLELQPGEKWADVFPFTIRDEASDAPRLDHPQRDVAAGSYLVRRAGRGMIRVTTPTGPKPFDVEVGGPGLRLERGLELSFRDTGHPEWTGSGELISVGQPFTAGVPGSGGGGASPDQWTGSGPNGTVAGWTGSGVPAVVDSGATVTRPHRPGPDPYGRDPYGGYGSGTEATTPQRPDPDPYGGYGYGSGSPAPPPGPDPYGGYGNGSGTEATTPQQPDPYGGWGHGNDAADTQTVNQAPPPSPPSDNGYW